MEPSQGLMQIIVDMKNLSELAVDLSYTALLFDSREIAEEVMQLEKEMDDLYYRARLAVLDMARSEQARSLLSLLQFVDAMEQITDSAAQLSEMAAEGTDLHPVFDIAMHDVDDMISRVDVEPGSILADRSLAELKLDIKVGADILAIKRNGKLIYDPSSQDFLRQGDILIVKGTEETLEKLRGLAGEQADQEETELTLDE